MVNGVGEKVLNEGFAGGCTHRITKCRSQNEGMAATSAQAARQASGMIKDAGVMSQATGLL